MSCLGESSMDFERPKANATAITDLGMEARPPRAGHTATSENKSRYEAVKKCWLNVFTLHTEQCGDRSLCSQKNMPSALEETRKLLSG